MAVVEGWEEKLSHQCELAKTSGEGTERFVEMSSNPMRHTWVVTGSKKNDGTDEHEVQTRMVGQPANYPVTPRTKQEVLKEGYRRYLTRSITRHQTSGNGSFTALMFEQWVEKFNAVTVAVDAAVRDCHGVKCYEDGQIGNEDPTNVFFMHACDVFNIYMQRINNNVPELFITTSSLRTLWVTSRNMLTDSIMTREELDFMVQEIDFLYTCFCYYGNFSFLPIRTQVASNSMIFSSSSFFTNDDFFKEHQRGKFLQVSQDHQRVFTPVCYRTI
jgi:hypothetical protein